jgi:hypothetical protein
VLSSPVPLVFLHFLIDFAENSWVFRQHLHLLLLGRSERHGYGFERWDAACPKLQANRDAFRQAYSNRRPA